MNVRFDHGRVIVVPVGPENLGTKAIDMLATEKLNTMQQI